MGEAYVSLLFGFLMLAAYATFFYRAADFEKAPPLAWAGLSIGVYLVTWLYFGWGWLGNLLTQTALLVALGIARGIRKELSRRDSLEDEVESRKTRRRKKNRKNGEPS